MNIIKATDAITIDHPVFLIFGEPGIGKTTLGYSAKRPLLLDFDSGAHRAANRGDTVKISTWADVDELLAAKAKLDDYDTVVPDTVGRLLDLMTTDIIDKNPRRGAGGTLDQQGWGILKTRFRTFMAQLRAMQKDVLLIAHHKEDKSGDVTIVRPDIPGGSLGEVMKSADFVGYMSMVGRGRVLDFNPTDRWVGKNPAQWDPFAVPSPEKTRDFLAKRFEEGRAALGRISNESAKIAQQVDDWRAKAETLTDAAEMNAAIEEIKPLAPMALAQVKPLLRDRAKALHLKWDDAKKGYVDPPKPNGSDASHTPITLADIPF